MSQRTSIADLNSQAHEHRVLILEFWAEWCKPCKRLAPVLDSLADETPELTDLAVNIDEYPDLARSSRS
ncbi:thioredoxin family protein [Catellatospora sp. NPDC049111]|uniref:thioredoxin family protein n=1 Tax=Catellatospora sp. NPDC049111 TaxID=3155271 RepID=UPI0033F11778